MDEFEWNGIRLPRGRRVLLDLCGTKHDPRQWRDLGLFDPERFGRWEGDQYSFIPQGGGEYRRTIAVRVSGSRSCSPRPRSSS